MNTTETTAAAYDALTAALLEIERFVGHGGWDQPARLFALVPTDAVIETDPTLAGRLGLRGSAEGAPAGALTSIEQQDFHAGEDLGATLAGIAWPAAVHGCALMLERVFLPPDAEASLPAEPDEAARFVARHPDRGEVRIVAGAMRPAGTTTEQCVARLRAHEDLLIDPQLAPALTAALTDTLLASIDPHDTRTEVAGS